MDEPWWQHVLGWAGLVVWIGFPILAVHRYWDDWTWVTTTFAIPFLLIAVPALVRGERDLALAATGLSVIVTGVAWLFLGYNNDALVNRYCDYGSVSRAQLAGCEAHVSATRVRDLSTHAAKFARGELDRCLADSGPFCGDD